MSLASSYTRWVLNIPKDRKNGFSPFLRLIPFGDNHHIIRSGERGETGAQPHIGEQPCIQVIENEHLHLEAARQLLQSHGGGHRGPELVRQHRVVGGVLCRHQYGEVFWKYKDLAEVYENGRKYGIDTLMVFGWWKGRFDNGYPLYEPDDALGGEAELKKAIKDIQKRGGRVILYTNGVLMDVKSDFYRNYGARAAMIDLDGNPLLDHYQFSNQGTVLRTFGYKTFAQACAGAKEWKQQMLHNGRVKLSMEPDSIFYDQVGGHRCWLCFNKDHKHGSRGDTEPLYRKENFEAVNELLGEEQAVGTENTVDIFDPYMDYHHGCDFGNWYAADVYPQLYLNTFPETIITNRFIHDEREDYRLQLNYALVCGYRFDVSIYRGRVTDMSGVPNYAGHVKRLLEYKEKHRRFFYPSGFAMRELPDMPSGLLMTQYVSGGEQLTLVLNCCREEREFSWDGGEYRIPGWGVLSICGGETEIIEGAE